MRAVGTGMVLGALLTPCNVYSGLKIGWSFNMSLTAAGFHPMAVHHFMVRVAGAAPMRVGLTAVRRDDLYVIPFFFIYNPH